VGREVWRRIADSMFLDAASGFATPQPRRQFAAVRLKHARLATISLAVSAFSCASFVDSP